ncbi:MAG: hypothetical protein GQ531_10440 [Sulfurovum sp.]|nr:hypothetical protein [Sulfurovum sp.]
MKKYLKNIKNMSLDEKTSWIIDKVPHILSDMENNINIDISDVNEVVDNDGDTICILENEYCGNQAAKKAIESATNLLNTDIELLKSTNGILVVLMISPHYIFKGDDPLDEIYTYVPYESVIIVGRSTNYTFSENYVKATIVFVGFNYMVI